MGRSREGLGHEVLSLVQGVGRAIFSYRQVLKKLASDVLRKFFAPKDGFNPLNMAKLEKLYLVQVKISNNATASV